MVALIHPPTPVRPAPSATRPDLRLVRGGLGEAPVDRTPMLFVAGLVVVLALIGGLRAAQVGSSPPLVPVPAPAVAEASPVEAIRIVESGDTLWAIAERLAPGRDPRPIVDALADRNGGTTLRVGQVLVIPADLAGSVDGSS